MKKIIFLLFFVNTFLFSNSAAIHFFYGKGCFHCKKEKNFLEKIKKKYKNIKIHSYEVWNNKENRELLEEVAKNYKIKISGIPVTFVGKKYFIGFYNEETTGKNIEKAILDYKNNDDLILTILNKKKIFKEADQCLKKINLPLFGEIEIKNFSLPILTILIAAIDGFNPCALWALLLLISILIGIADRKRIFLLGGIFIVVSGIVYFLFMMAWFNLLSFLKYIKATQVIIGVLAVLVSIYYLKEFFTNKTGACKVTSSKFKEKVSEKLISLTKKNKLFLSIIGIIVLAFFVNLIEIVCSAGLPIIYLQILSMNVLSKLQYYMYLFLYMFVFTLDDLIIFFVAMFSLQMVNMTSKYTRYAHLVGGILLFVIGMLLLFKPDALMFG